MMDPHYELQIFSQFVKNRQLYLILAIIDEPIDPSNLQVTINNQPVTLYSKDIKDKIEPIEILIYDIPQSIDTTTTTDITTTITYQTTLQTTTNATTTNITYHKTTTTTPTTIIHPPPTKKKLAITTLFKDDYNLFPLYYHYYKRNGIDHFYMYYNGKLKDLPQQALQMFQEHTEDVSLIEWDFTYWNPPQAKYKHNAQIGQIHDALHRYGKDSYDYMIFCDFDEYIYFDYTKIRDVVHQHPDIDVFAFSNIWAETVDRTTPSTTDPNNIQFPTTIDASDEKLYYGDRSKNILKLQTTEKTIGIHTIVHPHLYYAYNLTMYQFYTWTNNTNRFPRKFPNRVDLYLP
jgi:hypothetical protein